MSRRFAALLALIALVLGLAMLAWAVVATIPHGIIATVLLGVSLAMAWQGLIRRGWPRVVWWTLAAVLAVGAVAASRRRRSQGHRPGRHRPGRRGDGVRTASLHSAPSPGRGPAARAPVVIYNPKSGGGKAKRFHLADEARARGIKPIELRAGRRPRGSWCARPWPTGPTGSRWPAATARRRWSRRSPPSTTSLRLHPGRDPQPLRPRPRRRPRRRRRRPRCLRRRRRAARRPGRGQRPGLRQQRLARPLRRGRPARGIPRREDPDAPRHGARPAVGRPGAKVHPGSRWTGAGGQPERSAAVILVSNNVYRLGHVLGSGTRAPHRRRSAGHHRAGSAGPGLRTSLHQERVVPAGVRGGVRWSDSRGSGRRGTHSPAAAGVPDPMRRAARADRAASSRRVPVVSASDGHPRRDPPIGLDRGRQGPIRGRRTGHGGRLTRRRDGAPRRQRSVPACPAHDARR